MTDYLQLKTLITKYQLGGTTKGGELLLPLEIQGEFWDELGKLGVPVLGVDGWYYVNQAEGKIVQDISVDYYVGDSIINRSDRTSESIRRVKDFLSTLRADKTPLVSFVLDVPNEWTFFKNT